MSFRISTSLSVIDSGSGIRDSGEETILRQALLIVRSVPSKASSVPSIDIMSTKSKAAIVVVDSCCSSPAATFSSAKRPRRNARSDARRKAIVDSFIFSSALFVEQGEITDTIALIICECVSY